MRIKLDARETFATRLEELPARSVPDNYESALPRAWDRRKAKRSNQEIASDYAKYLAEGIRKGFFKTR